MNGIYKFSYFILPVLSLVVGGCSPLSPSRLKDMGGPMGGTPINQREDGISKFAISASSGNFGNIEVPAPKQFVILSKQVYELQKEQLKSQIKELEALHVEQFKMEGKLEVSALELSVDHLEPESTMVFLVTTEEDKIKIAALQDKVSLKVSECSHQCSVGSAENLDIELKNTGSEEIRQFQETVEKIGIEINRDRDQLAADSGK